MIGNKILGFVIVILFSGVAAAMPSTEPIEFDESTRIESVVPAETVNVPAAVIEQAVEPVRAPIVEPPKPPEPKPVVRTGNCSLVNNYDWPKQTAYGICMAESKGNSSATNVGDNHGKCRGSYGLMQVGCFWFPYYGYAVSQGHDAEINMKVAYQIYKRQGGFGAWTTYTSGKYKQYL